MMFRTRTLLVVLLLALGVPVFAQQGDTLVDVLNDNRDLRVFAEMIEFLGLEERYSDTDVFYTILALENDTAEALLNDLGYDELSEVSETDQLTLSVILSYHILPGAWSSSTFTSVEDVVGGEIKAATALPGTAITYEDEQIDGFARLIETDITAVNGYVHVLDGYLVPTTDAFETSIQIITDNGDLLENQDREDTIAQILQDDRDYSMIADAIDTIGLMDDLDEKGPYTIIVMTDTSLEAALDNGNLDWDEITGDEQGLTNLIQYHVLPGSLTIAALTMDETYIGTMLGNTVVGLTVDRDDTVRVNGIPLITTNIVASNGIIHVVDGLLLPPSGE